MGSSQLLTTTNSLNHLLTLLSLKWLQGSVACVCVYLCAQSCPTLCDPVGCSLPGSSVHGDSAGKNTGGGCHFLLQGIFPTQGPNPGLPHCPQILYQLSHKRSPRKAEGNDYFLDKGAWQATAHGVTKSRTQ